MTLELLLATDRTLQPSRSSRSRAGLYSSLGRLLTRPTERMVVVFSPPPMASAKNGVRFSVRMTTRLSHAPLSGSPVSAAANASSANLLSGMV